MGKSIPATGAVGASLVELVLVLALVGTGAGTALPFAARSIDAGRARQAAAYVAAEFRRARQQAAARTRSVAIVFDAAGSTWTFRLCADGNGNGVRRAELLSGTDPCFEGPYDLTALFPGVAIAIDPTLPSPDGGPGKNDPVQLGTSNLASFSANGTSSSGTVFVRSAGGEQYGVRVAGTTTRTRVVYFDTGGHRWVDR